MGYSAPEGEQFLTIPDAKLCICPRKALQSATQSFAIAHAKLCNHTCKRLLEKAQKKLCNEDEAVSKVTDTVSFFTYTKQSSDFPKPELCHVPDFLYLWT